ncbi:MAG TPA: putative nucleotide-diphospho-sugar transferase, partial [Spirochaetota bacterium]|nr:putative nucleotide-diphospho-sugar transferase [Spirochaetota bacterium]
MYNFCTLFDSNYLTRGLALYESLEKHCKEFNLYIFAFDDKCYDILKGLNLEKAIIISLKEFENERLLEAKKTRSRGEYCWTCSSSSILYVLENFKVDNCIYVDADVYFFNAPKILIEELPKDKSVIITEHRYPPHYAIMETNGKFCVQFVYFKNNDESKKVLKDWANKCIEWCYGRWEDNKFGDQKYLDEWPLKFNNIYILKNEGGGLAPWNLYNYKLKENENNFEIIRKKTKIKYPVVFYHFHDLRFYENKTIQLTGGYFMVPSYYKKLYYIY